MPPTEGEDVLTGTSGPDVIDGLGGDDQISGLNGDDELIGGNGDDQLFGGGGDDDLTGGDGDDVLDGGGGADVMAGGDADDTFYVDQTDDAVTALEADIINEADGEGSDTVIALVSYNLNPGASVEEMIGGAFINLQGNEFAQTLTGGSGAEFLDGNGGGDVMTGFAGDDRYRVRDSNDVVNEVDGEGNDFVQSAASFVLLPGVSVERLEALSRTGTAPIDLIGNEFDQFIEATDGNNRLDGGGGVDRLIGRLGDDTYVIDDVADTLKEVSTGGNDTVLAKTSWALSSPEYVETISAFDVAATTTINLYGSIYANAMNGNAGANYLDGGSGADVMTGFAGNDAYVVDNLGDVVVEGAGAGTDVIWATATYVLASGVSVETLSTKVHGGTEAINLYGNELANTLYGNAGANRLDGYAGADVMQGLLGNDSYYVDNAGDVVVEAAGGGIDAVWTTVSYTLAAGVQVESLSTYSHSGSEAINLTGNEIANSVYGNASLNTLDGGGGADTLYGFNGNDRFAFTTALGGGNVDRIVDFAPGADRIALENAVFTGLPAGALAAGAFNTGAGATQADDRIIYNSATGALLFDSDGTGAAAAVQFATVNAGLALGAGDFIVI